MGRRRIVRTEQLVLATSDAQVTLSEEAAGSGVPTMVELEKTQERLRSYLHESSSPFGFRHPMGHQWGKRAAMK